MTNRQFVRSFYPEAVVEKRVMPRNTIDPSVWYEARTSNPLGDYRLIARATTRSGAWRKARICLREIKPVKHV